MPHELAALVGLLQTGSLEPLERRASELLARDPICGAAWKALGVALQLQGKEALPALGRAAELLPQDAEAQANFGAALLATGRLQESIGVLQQAARLRPEDPEILSNLGNALRRTGQLEAALSSYEAAARLGPTRAELHGNLGGLLLGLGRPADAAKHFREAVALRPDMPEAHNNLANALLALGRAKEALMHAQRAIDLAPGSAPAHNTMGNALLELGQFESADQAYVAALAIDPTLAEAHANRAIGLRLRGRTDQAVAAAEHALAVNPQSAATRIVLADAHADRGEFAEAERHLREAIALDPDSPQGWAGLAQLRRMGPADMPWIERVRRILDAGRLAPRQEILLRHALGKTLDDLAQYDQAFAEFRRANELSRSLRAPYDRASVQADTDRLIRDCNTDWLARARRRGPPITRPVLVVGMPRSGTSLIEQILASHPDVFGAGEQSFWNEATIGLPTSDAERDAVTLRGHGDAYHALLSAFAPKARYVIDKMPENFRHLGLVHAALPDVRILHVRRNPMDTCLSIFCQDFKGALPYSTDLDDLAHYYGEYHRLMRHWHALLPAHATLAVSYEALVAEPERWTRRLLEFLGLPWDARCLQLDRTRRSVITASRWQVRQAVTMRSVGRWRHYAAHVAPLLPLRALEDWGEETAASGNAPGAASGNT